MSPFQLKYMSRLRKNQLFIDVLCMLELDHTLLITVIWLHKRTKCPLSILFEFGWLKNKVCTSTVTKRNLFRSRNATCILVPILLTVVLFSCMLKQFLIALAIDVLQKSKTGMPRHPSVRKKWPPNYLLYSTVHSTHALLKHNNYKRLNVGLGFEKWFYFLYVEILTIKLDDS